MSYFDKLWSESLHFPRRPRYRFYFRRSGPYIQLLAVVPKLSSRKGMEYL